jgi:hypothetical protein
MNHPVLAKVSALYPKLGNEIASLMPAGWETAWVQVEADDQSASMGVNGFCVTQTDTKPQYVRIPHSIFKIFEDMRKVTKESGHPPFTTVTFILHSDGKFNGEYGYDPVPIEGEYERRLAWEKKWLGGA